MHRLRFKLESHTTDQVIILLNIRIVPIYDLIQEFNTTLRSSVSNSQLHPRSNLNFWLGVSQNYTSLLVLTQKRQLTKYTGDWTPFISCLFI